MSFKKTFSNVIANCAIKNNRIHNCDLMDGIFRSVRIMKTTCMKKDKNGKCFLPNSRKIPFIF